MSVQGPAASVFAALGGTGVPEFYFVDGNGKLQIHMIGYEGPEALEADMKQVMP